MSGENFTFIDLFAGIGGCRLAAENVNGKCVFTSEIDKFSIETYKANFSSDHEVSGDIKFVNERDIPSHDVLIGGFPCQPFSISGVSKNNSMNRSHGFLDETRGTLFFDIARILSHHKPKAFILENVRNLRDHDSGKTFEVIKRTLSEELPYEIDYRVIDSSFVVPQKRERIYIVGVRKDLGIKPNLSNIDICSSRKPVLSDILLPEESISQKYVLSDKLWKYLKDYAEKHKKKGNGFGYGLVTENDVARTLSARYGKDGSEILIDRGDDKNPRRLTPRECARIMGFPESFKLPNSDSQMYKQFGNSVVVPVFQEVVEYVSSLVFVKDLEEELTTLKFG